jgi:hypothetical protein
MMKIALSSSLGGDGSGLEAGLKDCSAALYLESFNAVHDELNNLLSERIVTCCIPYTDWFDHADVATELLTEPGRRTMGWEHYGRAGKVSIKPIEATSGI